MDYNYIERDFYVVHKDHSIQLYGWLEERDNCMDGFEDDELPRHTLVTGDWPDYPNDPGVFMTDWAAPYQQYEEDMHYEDAVLLVKKIPWTHLPLYKVNDETPAGCYWCTFSEEPLSNMMKVMGRNGFKAMYSSVAQREYGWGRGLKFLSMVFLRDVGDTRVWVGELADGRFVCDVEVESVSKGQWEAHDPYEALLWGLINSVIDIAVNEMWYEPMAQGLKYCCEDVVLAAATYGAQLLFYGYDKLPELFPHTSDGVLTTDDELQLYRDLVDVAIEYVKEDSNRLGIEFEDVWS